MIFNVTDGGGGGTGATLTVEAPALCTVTVSKDGKNKTKTAGTDGLAVFKGLATGDWTVTITNGTDTTTETVNLVADYTKAMSFTKIYGIYRDVTASPTAWAREDAAVGKTATASVGTVAGHSDFSGCYPWNGIKRETLSTGDVMVKIPKFWFRRYREGNIEHIKIAEKAVDGFNLHPAFCHAGAEKDCVYVAAYKTSSNNKSVPNAFPQTEQTRETFRNNAKAKGDGWGILDASTISAIQILMLVEFADNNVQDKIGRGYCDGASSGSTIKTGSCDTVPGLTGRPSGTDGLVDVVWRGIEGFWGNTWEFFDGLNLYNGQYYVCNDPSHYADDTIDYFERLSFGYDSNLTHAFITEMGLDASNPHIILPKAAGSGSASTFYCDSCESNNGWCVPAISGSFVSGSEAGLFISRLVYKSTDKDPRICCRLLYIPQ